MKKLFSSKYTDNGIGFALLVLRLFSGILIAHGGYQKLMHFTATTQQLPDPFHVGHTASAALCIFAEFFCGSLIVIGLMTRLACIPLIINMSVALFVAHKGHVFGVGTPATLFLGCFITLLFAGPGKVSLDRLISK
jgi:putative oxidoreductase